MKYFTIAVLALASAALPVLPAYAAIEVAPQGVYASHQDDDEEDEDDSRYYRERYSSSVRRAVNKLDDDEVDEMPVPVLGVHYDRIYPDFGDPRDGGAREHEGQDILAPSGTPIVSPTDAVVTRTGKGSSAGVYVYTANPGGENFRYMHLDRIADGVKAGKVLKPGDLIGFVGNTGNAAGGPHHLHFEIRDGRRAEDPYPRLTGSFTNAELIRSLTAIVKVLQEEIRDLD